MSLKKTVYVKKTTARASGHSQKSKIGRFLDIFVLEISVNIIGNIVRKKLRRIKNGSIHDCCKLDYTSYTKTGESIVVKI